MVFHAVFRKPLPQDVVNAESLQWFRERWVKFPAQKSTEFYDKGPTSNSKRLHYRLLVVGEYGFYSATGLVLGSSLDVGIWPFWEIRCRAERTFVLIQVKWELRLGLVCGFICFGFVSLCVTFHSVLTCLSSSAMTSSTVIFKFRSLKIY